MSANTTFEQKLTTAKRVYPRVTNFSEAEYPYLVPSSCPKDIGDGFWICDCKHENVLTLHKGDHPFKRVRCPCDSTLHAGSRVSEILIPLSIEVFQGAIVPAWYGFGRTEVPYGSICQCGLTHRAIATGTQIEYNGKRLAFLDFSYAKCVCGDHFNSTWSTFYIGSPFNHHRDPMKTYNRVVQLDVERAASKVPRRQPKVVAAFTPTASMRRLPVLSATSKSKTLSWKALKTLLTFKVKQ
jgi:hypothetical protein